MSSADPVHEQKRMPFEDMTRLLPACLIVLAAATAAVLGCGADDRDRAPSAASKAGREQWQSLPIGWSSLPAPPMVLSEGVSVWSGRELILWGGKTNSDAIHHAGGAAFDPLTRGWRPLPLSPLSGRSSPAAVWTGQELVVWGGWTGDVVAGDGAALDQAGGSWRTLPASPLDPRVPAAAVWTEHEMIVWGDASRTARATDGAAYDPTRDRWSRLPPSPLALNVATAVWTGEEMIVFGALLDGGNHSETKYARGIAYEPRSNSWRVLPPFPFSPQASTAVWTGEALIVWDYELRAAAYTPYSNRWKELPDLPLSFSECYPKGAPIGGGLVFAWHCGSGALLDLAAEKWSVLTGPVRDIAGAPVAADGAVLAVGSLDDGTRNALWAYKPEKPSELVFVPRAEVRAGRVLMPITFPGGTSAVLDYPTALDLAGMGVQPDVSYLPR